MFNFCSEILNYFCVKIGKTLIIQDFIKHFIKFHHFVSLDIFSMIYFCVGCRDADAWSLLESLTGSGSTFNTILILNGNSNILCIDMIITKFWFYVVYSASALFDTISLQSNITRDIITEFVSCVARFEILVIPVKVSERIWKWSKSFIFSVISLLGDYNVFFFNN